MDDGMVLRMSGEIRNVLYSEAPKRTHKTKQVFADTPRRPIFPSIFLRGISFGFLVYYAIRQPFQNGWKKMAGTEALSHCVARILLWRHNRLLLLYLNLRDIAIEREN
jgi:hypothetical protein